MSAAQRASQLAKIHIGAKQLGLDRETYVALIRRVSAELGREVDSAGSLDGRGLTAVVREMMRLGFRAHSREVNKLAWAGRPKGVAARPLLGKIGALLADAKRPWRYAHALARKMFRVDRLEFLNDDQLRRVIAALSIDARRRARKPTKGTTHGSDT